MTPFDAEFAQEPLEPGLEEAAGQPLAPEEPSEEDLALQEVAELLAEYPFATEDEEKLLENVLAAEAEFYQAMESYNLFEMYRLAYGIYYGFGGGGPGEFETQSIRFGGESGERLEYSLNEFRSYCDQIFNMTTKNRPGFQAQAINTDAESTGQVQSSDSVIKYFYEQVFGERKEREVVKSEGLYGKGYTYIDWDADGGTEVEVDEPVDDPNVGMLPPEQQTVKKKVKSGAFDILRIYPWQAPCDPFRSERDGHDWRIVHILKNRYDLMARYPLFAKAIKETEHGRSEYAAKFPGHSPFDENNKDMVLVRYLLHKPTGVLPKGRRVVFVGTKMVDDGELPIDEIPLVDYMSCEADGSCFGVSDLWNIIPCQQLNNQMLSNFATNIEAFGSPPLAMFGGAEPNIDELANGQKLIMLASPEHMPQVVQFPTISEAHLKFFEMHRKLPMSLTQLNAVSRGESDASIKSGTHAALYHAMAVEAQTPRSLNLDFCRERVANIILMFLKKFAKHPLLVAITGEDERPYMQYFGQKDVKGVHRVVVKTANALLATTAGRMTVVETLRDWPGMPIKDPQQLIELLTTGVLKRMTNPAHFASMRAKRENEILSRGPEIEMVEGPPDPNTGMPTQTKRVKETPVFATDGIEHFWTHKEELEAPDTINNPRKLEALLVHFQEHVEMWRNNDPYLAQLAQGTIPAPMMLGGGVDDSSSSGKEGPSNEDMSQVAKMAPPSQKDPMDAQDDSSSAFGRVPSPAKPPGGGPAPGAPPAAA